MIRFAPETSSIKPFGEADRSWFEIGFLEGKRQAIEEQNRILHDKKAKEVI